MHKIKWNPYFAYAGLLSGKVSYSQTIREGYC